MTKQRVNLMIEDYDNAYLDETSKVYGLSKSELVGVAINLLTALDADGNNVFEQLAAIYDEQRPNAGFVPLDQKITRTSVYANVKITAPR